MDKALFSRVGGRWSEHRFAGAGLGHVRWLGRRCRFACFAGGSGGDDHAFLGGMAGDGDDDESEKGRAEHAKIPR